MKVIGDLLVLNAMLYMTQKNHTCKTIDMTEKGFVDQLLGRVLFDMILEPVSGLSMQFSLVYYVRANINQTHR